LLLDLLSFDVRPVIYATQFRMPHIVLRISIPGPAFSSSVYLAEISTPPFEWSDVEAKTRSFS